MTSSIRSAMFLLLVVSAPAQNLTLHNTLDSDAAVLNSVVGPPLSFYTGGAPYPMVVGTRAYEPGRVGNALTYGPGPYQPGARANLLTLVNPGAVLSSERGTIEAWCFSREELLPYYNNSHIILGGVYCGQEGGFGMWAQNVSYQGTRLYFYLNLCGTDVYALSINDGQLGFPIVGLTNQWLHFAACWDRAGIAGTNHTVRLYLNGQMVAYNTASNWGTTFGPVTYAASASDQAIAHKFLFDELKVWDGAKTAFDLGVPTVLAWGNDVSGQCNVPALPAGLTYVGVAAGRYHTLARLSDGSIVAWGENADGQCNVPVLPPGLAYVGVAAGSYHTLALRSDGSIVAWGRNLAGQCNVPVLPPGLTYVEVTAGFDHSLARRSDGSVVAWGYDFYGQCNVSAFAGGLTCVEVAAGAYHSVARLSDGSVIAWGRNVFGQCNVPALPAGLTYVEIAAGDSHTVARRSDGSVVAWGHDGSGQCNVPPLPVGLSYVEISAGWLHTLARRSDGSVIGWGDNSYGQCNIPVLSTGLAYVELAAGDGLTVLRTDVAVPLVPAAAAVSVGTGCGGAGTPVFGSSAPRLGHEVTLSLIQGTPSAPGGVFFSTVPAVSLSLGACSVQLDLATVGELMPMTTTATGGWAVSLPIPYDPSIVGLSRVLQVALFGTQGPIGIDLSNGVIATVGY